MNRPHVWLNRPGPAVMDAGLRRDLAQQGRWDAYDENVERPPCPAVSVAFSREELAWSAGFYDGEGSLCARSKVDGKSFWDWFSLVLSIHQVDVRNLRRFQAAIGGRGAIYGPYTHNLGRGADIYQLVVTRFEDVQAIVAMLWRWLSPAKREQAAIACARVMAARLLRVNPRVRGPRATCHPDRAADRRGLLCRPCNRRRE